MQKISTEISDRMADARGFWNAARAVYADCVKDDYFYTDTYNPLLFLLGHSVECLLKACLLKQGENYQFWCQKPHDLEFLLRHINIVSITGDLSNYIKTINENFSKHEHRYSKTFSGEPDEEAVVIPASMYTVFLMSWTKKSQELVKLLIMKVIKLK